MKYTSVPRTKPQRPAAVLSPHGPVATGSTWLSEIIDQIVCYTGAMTGYTRMGVVVMGEKMLLYGGLSMNFI